MVRACIRNSALQAAFQVVGNHATITIAGASGNFELNVAKPVIIYNLLQSIDLMAHACTMLANKFVAGIKRIGDRELARREVEKATKAKRRLEFRIIQLDA